MVILHIAVQASQRGNVPALFQPLVTTILIFSLKPILQTQTLIGVVVTQQWLTRKGMYTRPIECQTHQQKVGNGHFRNFLPCEWQRLCCLNLWSFTAEFPLTRSHTIRCSIGIKFFLNATWMMKVYPGYLEAWLSCFCRACVGAIRNTFTPVALADLVLSSSFGLTSCTRKTLYMRTTVKSSSMS